MLIENNSFPLKMSSINVSLVQGTNKYKVCEMYALRLIQGFHHRSNMYELEDAMLLF